MSEYQWQYHGKAPKAGRKLVLLKPDELPLALPLIYRRIQAKNASLQPTWFNENIDNQEQAYFALEPLLTQLVQQRKKGEDILPLLKTVNVSLNAYFSDLGWRMIRKELSQIKKRQKKSHLEVSNDIIFKLKHYMQKYQFDSVDQAIDNLLSEHDASVKNSE
ncbi:hypothetical protein [uncultured Shewanella sp.]|uniref:hypothetical protein n=1 Tax=uncultured Shewanella sp. TaxID=173975 RepID=UPI002621F4E8|nr:hypothetical protein [uncultured Shewanella sp.]